MSLLQQHPKALPFLFLTEMWERFGFYVVQGLLVLYMTQSFHWSDSQSYSTLGIFTALAYSAPLFGGYVATHYLDIRKTIITGGLFLILGYALLTLPQGETWFFPALSCIVLGNGFFKPNISSLLGAQYDANDTHRDSGFTIFYVGINIGVFLAGLISGYVRNWFGWQASFGLASIGLIIGVLIFLKGQTHFRVNATPNKPISLIRFSIICVAIFLLLTQLFRFTLLANWLLPTLGIILVIALTQLTRLQDPPYREKLLTLNILILSSVIFWMLFLQMFYAANLFIDRLVQKEWMGITLTTTEFYASESVFIFLLGPVFAILWQKLNQHQCNPSPIRKFAFGTLMLGLGFGLLGASVYFPTNHAMVLPIWIFTSYLFITIGELCVSPIGLSAVTSLAPPNWVNVMMGIWFVATGFGGIFAGWLAQLANVPKTMTDPLQQLLIYQHAFFQFALVAFLSALCLVLVEMQLKKKG